MLRDVTVYDGPISVAYSTSDITAKGVDQIKFTECLAMATNLRAKFGCGDYEQTAGTIKFASGSNSGGFNVRITNNLCLERHFRYIQVCMLV